MKKKDVSVGKVYAVKVSGKVVPVKLVSESSYGGWNGKSLVTGRKIRVKTGGRLRKELKDSSLSIHYRILSGTKPLTIPHNVGMRLRLG